VRLRERQYGGARIIEVAPIKESTANAIDTPEGRLTSAAPKEAGGEAETIDKSRVKTEKIKKEKTSEEKKIKLEKKVKVKSRQPSTSSGDSSEEENDIPVKRTSRQKEKGGKKRNKHRRSDTGEDGQRNKKGTKDKTCKDKVKMKKRRKLEFLTDVSSKKERPKTTRKHKTATEDDSTSQTSTEEDSMCDASTIKSTRKEKHKNGKHFRKWLVLEKFDGTTPLSKFFNSLDTSASYNGWDIEDKASYLRVRQTGLRSTARRTDPDITRICRRVLDW